MSKSKTKALKLHPWDKIEIPNLSLDEQQRLKNSVEKYGLKHPILALADGRIIDGKHRYAILGGNIPEDKLQILDLSEDEAEALAYSVNLDRRQLSGEQLKALLDVVKYQTVPTLRSQGMTQAQVSKITGIPPQTISRDEQKSMTTNSQMGNSSHKIPDMRVKVEQPAREQIIERAASGETERQIADDYKLSQQRVHAIIFNRECKRKNADRQIITDKFISESLDGDLKRFVGVKDFLASLLAFEKILKAAQKEAGKEAYTCLYTKLLLMADPVELMIDCIQEALAEGGV